MLSGKKPFAAFYRCIGEHFDPAYGQDFKKYLKNCTIKSKKFRILQGKMILEYTAYFPPSEEWRFYIYRYLKISSSKTGIWTKDHEIIEGMLFGYKLNEIEEHVS